MNQRTTNTIAVLLGLCILGLAENVTASTLDVEQPYSAERSNPVTYNAELMITVTAPYKAKQLRVWLPIPPSNFGQQLLSSDIETFPDEVKPALETEPVFGNRFAYFEFANPQGAQVIRHQIRIKVWELRWHMDPEKVQANVDWPDSFQPYLRSENQAVVIDDRFEKLFHDIVPEHRGPLADLQSVMNWADKNFTYDHSRASLKASSLHAFESHAGHCSDYHGFCAAMGRVMSQPTRVTYGINPFPKASPSHCKLEAFLPPYGWVSFDVSETQKLSAAVRANKELSQSEKDQLVDAAHRRLTSGFRDNTWFMQTKGTDYELVPKASQRVPVVRTIYAEADGKPLPDPDPSNEKQTTFAWMTAQKFESDVPVVNPFAKIESLREWINEQ
jgi:hypothetical protein